MPYSYGFSAMQRRFFFVLIACLLICAPAYAQPGPSYQTDAKKTRVSWGLTLAPTFNWVNDADVRLLDALQDDPEGVNADSLLRQFNSEEPPVEIGFKAGLNVTVSRGWAGLRFGLNFLNTGGVFDGTSYLNEDKLRDNFVTFLADLQVRRSAGPATFYAFGGPELRYRLDLSDEESITAASFRDNMEPLGALATFGLGVDLRFGGMSVAPEIRFAYDISGVADETFEVGGNTFEFTNPYRLNTLLFGLNFGF